MGKPFKEVARRGAKAAEAKAAAKAAEVRSLPSIGLASCFLERVGRACLCCIAWHRLLGVR